VAGKKERQRRLARERHERRVARDAERRQHQRKMTHWAGGVVVLVVVAAIVGFTFYHLSNHKAKPSANPTPSTSVTAPTPTPTPTPAVTEPATHCVYTPGGTAARNVGVPPARPAYKATYQATITTNRGPIVIDLLNSKATCTVNSFVFLAVKKYFNNTHCHRLVTSGIYVLQCGDPTGTGTGGPGYQFADENLSGAAGYPAGTVAMANAGPNTNGSQFFMVYQNNSALQAAYTPFGRIVSGLSIIKAVAKAGVAAGGTAPKESVIIKSITIKKI
jgi:peptidyl-prolyl cis-trans isomerase B (cyclophilin B)